MTTPAYTDPGARAMAEPFFTVVIPTYDRLPFLREAVDSVLGQSFGEWELLVVDDGSSDGTGPYCRGLEDSRIRYVPLPHSGLVGRVRNGGAKRARGRFLAFLDSDDLWKPLKLERQRKALGSSGAVWSYTGFEVRELSGVRRESYVPPGERGASRELLTGLVSTQIAAAPSTLAVSTEVFRAMGGFSEHPEIREDHDLVLRLAEEGHPRIEVPEILTTIRDHDARSDAGGRDPFLRSAVAYRQFLDRHPEPAVARVARAILEGHLLNSARFDLSRGRRRMAREKLLECRATGWMKPGWWWALLRALA